MQSSYLSPSYAEFATFYSGMPFVSEGREGRREGFFSMCSCYTKIPHTFEIFMENKCSTKWIPTYAKHPGQTKDQPLTDMHLGNLLFSDYLGDSHWAFPLQCELQKPKDGVFFTLETPAVSTRSVIVG